MTTREATPAEAQRIEAIEHAAFGTRVNPCQSIPPRHTPHTAGNGRTYCTTCGEDITE